MDLSFFPLTLEAVDQAAAESLCLFIGSDERPLTGLAGLADWRLSGKLSRLLRSGVLTGDAGEAVLTPPGSRLGFRKLFLFGVGPGDQGESALVERVGEALQKLAQAGVQEAAMQLPARLSPEVGIRTLVYQPQGPARAMVFGADPQKLVAALSQAASRGQAQLERRVVKVQGAAPKVPPPIKQRPLAPTPPSVPRPSPLPFAPSAAAPAARAASSSAAGLAGAPGGASTFGAGFAGDGRSPQGGALEVKQAARLPLAGPVLDGVALPDVPVAPVVPPSTPPPLEAKIEPQQPKIEPPPAPAPPPPAASSPAASSPAAPSPAASSPAASSPAPAQKTEPPKPAPPPSQKYVPQEPKQNVFDKKRKKKR